jgi:hypothetical protein
VISILMQKLFVCVRDAVTTSDMCIVLLRSVCRKFVINCDCPMPKPPRTEVQLRYSTVIFDICTTVDMVNSADLTTLSLTYVTRLE